MLLTSRAPSVDQAHPSSSTFLTSASSTSTASSAASCPVSCPQNPSAAHYWRRQELPVSLRIPQNPSDSLPLWATTRAPSIPQNPSESLSLLAAHLSAQLQLTPSYWHIIIVIIVIVVIIVIKNGFMASSLSFWLLQTILVNVLSLTEPSTILLSFSCTPDVIY